MSQVKIGLNVFGTGTLWVPEPTVTPSSWGPEHKLPKISPESAQTTNPGHNPPNSQPGLSQYQPKEPPKVSPGSARTQPTQDPPEEPTQG